jgi:hypothetical protein
MILLILLQHKMEPLGAVETEILEGMDPNLFLPLIFQSL